MAGEIWPQEVYESLNSGPREPKLHVAKENRQTSLSELSDAGKMFDLLK
jgi:hypothetical protein